MTEHLLPPNTTVLERATASACAPLGALPVPLHTLWHPATCPLSLLPYLAWTLSVDRWQVNWPEAVKRQVTQQSFLLHQRKGTISALRQAVEPLGYRLAIQEWWQAFPMETPGTFRLRLSVNKIGITDAMFDEVERLIDDVKPISRHVVGLTIVLESHGHLRVSAATFDGETLTVYPYTPAAMISGGVMAVCGSLHIVDSVSLYS